MASISEDTGEETPLQVCHLDHCFIGLWSRQNVLKKFLFGNLITGAVKWSCNIHRYSGAHGGSCCTGSSSCEVNKSFGLQLHDMLLRAYNLELLVQIFYRNYTRF